MGLLSKLAKVAVTAYNVAQNIDKVDSAEEMLNSIPNKLNKIKDMAGKALDMVSSEIQKMEDNKNIQEKINQGYINERTIKILPEELLDIEYSITPKYEQLFPISNELFAARSAGKCGVVDINDTVIIPFEYDSYCSIFMSDGLISMQKYGKCGFINTQNEVVIDFRFYDVGTFSFGLAPAAIDPNHWGYINKKGEFVVEPTFASAEYFRSNGLAKISRRRLTSRRCFTEYGVINTEGKIIVQPAFDYLNIYQDHIEGKKLWENYQIFYYDIDGTPIAESFSIDETQILDDEYITRPNTNCSPCEEIELYNDSQIKYGWYKKIDGQIICKIKPTYDSFQYTKYSLENGGYSIVKYAGSYGIIKIGAERRKK